MVKNTDKFKVNYHVNAKGLFEPFCSLLDCYDQICYFEFRKVSDLSRWIYFCDDISLEIDKCGNISVMRTMVNTKYQKKEEYVITDNHFQKIGEFIKNKGAIALCTAFNYVNDFVWSGKGKDYLHTQHLTYIISEDQDCYYVVDSPWNLKNYENIRLETNYSIVKIKKEQFREAFEYYCKVLIIRFENLPSTKNEEEIFLNDVLNSIVAIYFSKSKKLIQGRQAILNMHHKCDLGDEKIFESSFIFHIMVSRRLLLRRGLNQCCSSIRNYKEIVHFLDESIAYWKQIKDLSDDCLYRGKKVCDLAKCILPSLLVNEDKLMRYLGTAI